ncbi:MAG: Asp-tRNA(Asn)/Glu-tRNA(Gln) amidotransferase subunit GatA [Verrucomicrobia bacterium]|nr:MAG: Asp-tRNA(Asn)/Glu-tRNA(Gln) amidotransferase subunit GatA [Verrucomicrobiota bacterium]
MTAKDLPALSVADLQSLLRQREVSPREVIDALQARIETVDREINAYLSLDFEAAAKEAEKANVDLPLGGVPIAVKDIISVAGQPCTCASKILRSYKLTRNPWELSRVPGGSSGGSAAAVAADTAFGALGTDTGGSIRQPAALSGIVGLKPTYGRVSRFGLVAFASSLDQIGPLTKTVRDAALLMNAIAGHDPQDSTCLNEPVADYAAALGHDLRGTRLGLPKEYMVEGTDPQVKTAIDAAVKHLNALGAEIIDISLPHTEYATAVYYILATAEASANLARFDGVRYGYRADNPKDLLDHYGRTREEGFGPEVKRRIILGTYVLSSGYYDAYYLRAQKVRELIRQDFSRAFERVDALISPTSPVPAFKFGERTADPLQMYLTDIFTCPANLAGVCGISVPCGFAEIDGKRLPIGVQLLGKALDETRILQIAHAFEQTSQWHKERAPIAATLQTALVRRSFSEGG